jgi:hypothetical protein
MRFGNNGLEPHQRKAWTQPELFDLVAHKAGLRAALAEQVTCSFAWRSITQLRAAFSILFAVHLFPYSVKT